MGYSDKSHMWVEAGKYAIDTVLWEVLPNGNEIIFYKRLHKQLLYQYADRKPIKEFHLSKEAKYGVG